MTTQIVSDVNFTDPTNLIPFLEKDDAIIRNVTKGMFDFSNLASLNNAGLNNFGQVATSLTSDAGAGTAAQNLPAQVGGLIDFAGASKAWGFPNTFKLANTCKRFLAILWVKLPGSGYQTASGNTTQSLMGYMNNTTTLAQWGIALTTVQATGIPNVLQAIVPASGGVASSPLFLSNADTLALCDGNLHQVALYFDGESSAGQRIVAMYVDKVSKGNNTSAWDGTFNVPAASANLGQNTAFQANTPANYKLGRPSLWDLTGTAWTPAQILQRDWDAAQGWIV